MKLLLLSTLFFVFGEEELESEKEIADARLLASKKTESKYLAQNVDLTFTYKIYNIGKSAALSVDIEDENFNNADNFEVVSGNFKQHWDRIEPDGVEIHEVIVKPLKAGEINITSATVTYKINEGASVVTMYTSDYGSAMIMEEREYLRKHASHYQDWVVFLLFTIPSLLLPYLLYSKSKSKYENLKSKRT
jgi:translocon-associated protein subunit beta